ncbi:hypothetical protein F2Q69_00061551 [Brassica cretica]|uniref:Uncharacterized protein n=1 Tax=Brassica cretica TaxID=69181 RepID=A0A8S9RC98_BRACR|nr:hypothetical protein F2Q69_00061551 [Brassica cretica]
MRGTPQVTKRRMMMLMIKLNAEPLKLEAEPSSGSTSNSLVIWQVYALGGFLVLKWAWARWNERNATSDKKEDDDADDQAPHPEDD